MYYYRTVLEVQNSYFGIDGFEIFVCLFLIQDQPLSPIRSSVYGDSTSDLERTYSEKSIDEAILEHTGSPVSLTHITSPKSPPPRPPPPKFSPSKKAASTEEESPFHRQFAKRGLRYSQGSTSGLEDEKVKVQSPESEPSQSINMGMLSTDKMSTSMLSSPGHSPSASPAITPRSSQ